MTGIGGPGDEFGGTATPVPGGGHSVCLMTPDPAGRAVEGAPLRFVADLRADGPRLRDVLRHGACELPTSPDYDDQTVAHARGETHPVPLTGPQPGRDRTLTLRPLRRRGGRSG
ncbi:penicillin acylase family protein [Polymorphospora sp. NPDC051019]|uniref:penicillin acylase family protein n=1 Tax=Polymorphospora sp. NPDC051019 TaxID=3155725 RepID=UPI003428BE55